MTWLLCLAAGLALAAAWENEHAVSCLQHSAAHRPRGARAETVETPGGPGVAPSAAEYSEGEEPTEPSSCSFQAGSFIRPSLGDLSLDFAVLQQRPSVAVMVTAMSLGGVYSDENGFDITRAEPLEDVENAMLIFRRSNQSVDIYKPGLDIRTSDKQSAEALDQGLGDGWLGSLDRLLCRVEDGRAPIAIDGKLLVAEGFFVASQTVRDAETFRILEAKSFPSNLDVAVEYLIGGAPLKVGFSVVLLPEVAMIPRASDDRLLFFTSEFKDIGYREATGAPSHEVDRPSTMIWRYNLEAMPGRQLRIFVDPSVPTRWREWFRQGIEAWNDAFHYRALRAVLPGDEDWPKDYALSDARFSTISWDLSDEVSSMGMAKVDPRSGEILKSDITMSSGWVKAWLQDLDDLAPGLTHEPEKPSFLQSWSSGLRRERRGAAGTRLRALNATQLERLMGAGLKSIVMHETGHILGLRHNFKGSLGVTLECLQDKACTAKKGLSASVMDYVPANIPDASDPEKVDAFSPVIGGYDKLAIAFGYTQVEKEHWPKISPELQKILKQAEDYEVCYDESESGEDPKCMAYDMSQEPLTYFEQELERYVQAQKQLLESSVSLGEPYRLYGEAVSAMLSRIEIMARKLVKWLGGIEDHFLHRASKAKLRSARPIPRLQQQRALALLSRILRPSENGLLPPEENLPFLVEGQGADQIHSQDISNMVHTMTGNILDEVLGAQRLIQISRQELLSSEALRLDDVLDELISTILYPGLAKAAGGKSLAPQDMDLQLILVSKLKDLYLSTSTSSKQDIHLGDITSQKKLKKLKSKGPKSKTVYLDEVKELPVLREPIGAKLMYFLQRAREKTLMALEGTVTAEAPEWRHCGELGSVCHCPDGLVRLAGDVAAESLRAVGNKTVCSEKAFHVAPVAGAERWCECLAPGLVSDSGVRSHLKLLLREFAGVFCEEFETCESPRIRLLELSPLPREDGKYMSTRRVHKYIWFAGGLTLILVAAAAFCMFARRR